MDTFVVVGIVFGIEALLALVVNVAVVVCMLKFRRLRTLSVGVNDALLAVSLFPSRVIENVRLGYAMNISRQQCTIEHIGLVFTLPASKAGLLVLTLDRLYAVFTPIAYRVRNHMRGYSAHRSGLAALMALKTARLVGDDAIVCSTMAVLPAFGVIVPLSILFDLLIYAANGLLLWKTRRNPMVPTGAALSPAEERRVKRDADMTRSVMGAVGVRLLCATIPSLMFGVASALNRKHIFDDYSFMLTHRCVSFVAIAETVVNVYVYYARLPFFRDAIRRATPDSMLHTLTKTAQ